MSQTGTGSGWCCAREPGLWTRESSRTRDRDRSPRPARACRGAVVARFPKRSVKPMTMTNTAMPAGTTAPSRGPLRGTRWRNLQTVFALLALLVLLAPVLYLFTQLWSATGASASTTATERAAVSYARPIDKVLAALVDAEYTAAGGTTVDPDDLRAAIDEVNAVDRRSGDPLQVRQRWTQLVHEIDTAIGQNAGGADALRAY